MRMSPRSLKLLLGVSLPIFVLCFAPLFVTNIGRQTVQTLTRQLTCTPRPESLTDEERNVFHHANTPCTFKTDDEVRLWVPTRDGGTYESVREFSVVNSINSLGFRNREYPLEKAPGVRRIILLGDSMVFGYGLPAEKGFFTLLEQRLSRRCRCEVEVWNFAAVSWNTVIEYLVTKHKLGAYDPDLVALFFDDSDRLKNPIFHKNGVFKDGDLTAVPPFDYDGILGHAYEKENALVARHRPEYPPFDPADVAVSSLYLEKTGRVLRDRGVPYLVVFVPGTHNPAVQEKWQTPVYESLKNAGVNFVNFFDRFGPREMERYFFRLNKHWNEEGSIYVAGLLEEYLCDHYPELLRCSAPSRQDSGRRD